MRLTLHAVEETGKMTPMRTDCHAPSNIKPEDYEFEGCFYLIMPQDMRILCAFYPDAFKAFQEEKQRWLDRLAVEGFAGNFRAKKNCDHCGAHFHYANVWMHKPTQQLIVVGQTCADNTMEKSSRAQLEYGRLVSRVHSVRELAKSREAAEKRKSSFFELYPDMIEALKTDHYIVRDIATRLNEYGSLTDKQVALVRKLASEALQPKEAEEVWLPVTEGRRSVVGTILATKTQEGFMRRQSELKMLVKVDGIGGSEKIWCTCPRSLWQTAESDASLKGARISMTITVVRSRNDATFGIGKRPASAEFITEETPTGPVLAETANLS